MEHIGNLYVPYMFPICSLYVPYMLPLGPGFPNTVGIKVGVFSPNNPGNVGKTFGKERKSGKSATRNLDMAESGKRLGKCWEKSGKTRRCGA